MAAIPILAIEGDTVVWARLPVLHLSLACETKVIIDCTAQS